MTIDRIINGEKVSIELTPQEINHAYDIKDYEYKKNDIINAINDAERLRIGEINLSKDFLQNNEWFINDVMRRYDKMDDHIDDYNMALKDTLYFADKEYVDKLLDEQVKAMSQSEKDQHIEAAEMAMDYNSTNGPGISEIDYRLYEKLIEERSQLESNNISEMKEYINDISKKCHQTSDKCYQQSYNDIFLSDKQAVQAIKLGIPIGYVSKYPDYHGSFAGLYTFNYATDKTYEICKKNKFLDKGPVFHYTLDNDQKEKLLSIIDKALGEPEFAKKLEAPRKSNQNKQRYTGRK